MQIIKLSCPRTNLVTSTRVEQRTFCLLSDQINVYDHTANGWAIMNFEQADLEFQLCIRDENYITLSRNHKIQLHVIFKLGSSKFKPVSLIHSIVFICKNVKIETGMKIEFNWPRSQLGVGKKLKQGYF